MKQKVLISSAHIKDNEFASFAQKIILDMTSNPNFTTPQPTLAIVQGLITLYIAALVKSIDGSKEDTANKNACRTKLESALSVLANYVNLISDYDVVKLESSGFTLSKIHAPIGILEAPNLLIHFGNNPGEVNYEISPVHKATSYILLYSILPAPADSAEWRSRTVSGTKGTLMGLDHETKYIFKATATSTEANKLDLYNFSNPVEHLVP